MKTLVQKLEEETLSAAVNTTDEEFTLFDHAYDDLSLEELKSITVTEKMAEEMLLEHLRCCDGDEYLLIDSEKISETNFFENEEGELYVGVIDVQKAVVILEGNRDCMIQLREEN